MVYITFFTLGNYKAECILNQPYVRQFIKRIRYASSDVCVACYSIFYSLYCVIFAVMQ